MVHWGDLIGATRWCVQRNQIAPCVQCLYFIRFLRGVIVHTNQNFADDPAGVHLVGYLQNIVLAKLAVGPSVLLEVQADVAKFFVKR